MMTARILGVGLLGPGLTGWQDGGEILAGRRPLELQEVVPPPPEGLSSRERRRTSPAVRLALAVAKEAVKASAIDPRTLPSVFAWAHGDGTVVQRILEVLATSERHVSPTEFHNSVHNVAVGYWTIAAGSHEPSSSLAAARDTVPAGLLKALAQVRREQRPLLLAVCDSPFPEPLNSACRVGAPFGFALVLAPESHGAGVARVTAGYHAAVHGAVNGTARTGDERPGIAALHELWERNAAARALPLLERLARRETARLQLSYGNRGRVELGLAP